MSDGKRVASGRLRVDAARAVDKLRAYQLPDPTAWVLEVIRAAVAFGATAVRVTGDADDVRVAWDGPAPDDETLARLFDDLVDPAPRRERRPIRLLATGVNTALGLGPRWIDVIVTDGEGGASAVRYSPRLLETQDGTASALRELRAEPRRPPREAPARGALVHLRRLPLLDAVPIMVGYGEPRELTIARTSCDDSRVPIHVGRSELGQTRSHGDLLRLALGDGLDGFLALLDPSFALETARLEVAELGVVLARYQLPLEAFEAPRAPVPLRLFVDAARMPTNASRSAVRLEESPLQESLTRAGTRLPAMLERLATELGDAPDHAWGAVQLERLRAAAIQLLAVHAAGMDWRARLISRPRPVLEPLLDLPLLRDALGRPRTPRSFRLTARGLERVHLGREPLPSSLEPWLGDSLWVPPGDPAAALLGTWVPERASDLAKLAGRHEKKRDRFTGQRAVDAKLGADAASLLVVPVRAPGRSLKSCVDPALFEVPGLAGEVAIHDPSGPGGGITFLLDGRPITRWSPILGHGIEGVATCADLTPTVDYSGLEDDEAAERLRRAVSAAAVVGFEALALRWRGSSSRGDRARDVAPWIAKATGAEAERVRATLAAGLGFALDLLAAGSADVDPQSRRDAAVRALLESRSPLVETPMWPVVGGSLATTRQLLVQASTPPLLVGYHRGRAPEVPTPEGRAVYELGLGELALLRAYRPAAQLVDYTRALARSPRSTEPGALAAEVIPPRGVAIEITSPGLRAAVAWGGRGGSRLTVRHWGVRLAADALEATPPVTVLVEDTTLVPDPTFSKAKALPKYSVHAWTESLARDFVTRISGKDAPRIHLGAEDPIEATAGLEALLSWIADSPGPEKLLGKQRFGALRRVPFVSRLGRADRCTLADVLADFGDGPIDVVSTAEAAAFDLGGWHPIRATDVERTAFARILGRDLTDGAERLAELRRQAARGQALERHRARALVDPRASSRVTYLEVKGRGIDRAGVAVASGDRARVQVLIESRPYLELERDDAAPIDAFVDLPPSAADDRFEGLSPEGDRRVRYVLGAGARELLKHVAATSPASLTAAPNVRRLLAAWCDRLRDHGGNETDKRAAALLAGAAAYETLQGTVVALPDAATDRGALRVATWDEPWLGPVEGERADPMDRPVLRLPAEDPAAYRAMLKVLWGDASTRDVTSRVARLQSARRVASGAMAAPRLEGTYDARFRYALADVLDETAHASALETLGIGEVALASARHSRVTFSRGDRRRVVESGLVPPVHVAAHRPDLGAKELASKELAEAAEKALEVLIGLVVRRAVDGTPPDQLPEWLRRSLLDASLRGGALHLERLADTPMLPTSAGTWVTPNAVRVQTQRFGAVWTTTKELVPLDPARIALRLDREETQQLAAYVAAEVADAELELDRRARENLAQPPVRSLDPTPAEQGFALVVLPIEATEGSSAHGTITVLAPAGAALRGFHPSRSFHPLGAHADPMRWPCVTRIDDPSFTPDRTWSGPLEDDGARRLRSRARSAVDQWLAQRLPFPHGKLAGTRLLPSTAKDLGLPLDLGLEGVVWLEGDGATGALTLNDPGGERIVASVGTRGEPLPVHGELMVTTRLDDGALRKLGAHAYERLLARLAERLSDRDMASRRDVGLGHLLAALAGGAAVPNESLTRVRLACVTPESTLADVQACIQRGGFFTVCPPPEVELAKAAADGPVVVDDGSPEVRQLLAYLGSRAVGWRQVQRAGLLGGVDAAALAEQLSEPVPQPMPTPSQPAPTASAPSAFEQAMLARWNRLPLSSMKDARIDGRRRRPAVSFVGDRMLLAGRHPVVQRAVEAFETGDGARDALVTLLLASAAGAMRRGASPIGVASEHALLTELMRDADQGAR
ncbi:MAG: hypothetical protein H6719_29650 [Sandaracinaceae bacterium]|nr:hypothetical protein [Sandaracinaceae bacterium]